MKKWISIVLTLTLLCFMMVFVGVAQAEDTTVTFSTDMLSLAAGKTATVRVSVRPYAANKKGVTYASTDESIATVTSKGKVTAIAIGQCQITATSVYDPAVTASLPVQVVKPVDDLTVTTQESTVYVGGTLALAVTVEPADATDPSVIFASSRDSIATVSPDGVITGVARGSAKITVTSRDGYAKTTFAITVAQAPESIEISPETAQAAIGRKVQLKATVLPSSANDRTVQWSSADETIATVNSKGQVTIIAAGETQITATSSEIATVSASIPVRGVTLAQSVAFDNIQYSVIIGETTQLYVNILPDAATDKAVTYSVKNKKIATVDENGLVTGVKGGKTTVYATTADGSKKRASTMVEVIVPVTGVSYKYKDVRVGNGSYGTFTATLAPSDATNKAMTWVSSDESIATVTGTTNRFKIVGRRWGRCKITGTTVDGEFSVSIYADIGSLRHAVVIADSRIKDGKPYLKFINKSDMNISQVRFELLGYDLSLQPIAMSTQGDVTVLEGAYNSGLASGESTIHGQFTFYNKSNFANLAVLQACITGWSTDSGYYDHNGKLQYNYNIPEDQWEWITYPTGTDVSALAK